MSKFKSNPHGAQSPVKEADKQQLKYCVITIITELCGRHYQNTEKRDWGVREHFPYEMITGEPCRRGQEEHAREKEYSF